MPHLRREAQNVYDAGDSVLVGDISLRQAKPKMRAKRAIMIKGVGKPLTGIYYVESVTHDFSTSGYTQKISVSRNGFGLSLQKPAKPSPKPSKPKSKARKYTIKRGDTLWWISDRYYKDPLKWKTIAKANNINWNKREEYRLQIGRVITIP